MRWEVVCWAVIGSFLVDGDEPQEHVEQQVGEVFGEALQHVGLLRGGVTRLDGGAAR